MTATHSLMHDLPTSNSLRQELNKVEGVYAQILDKQGAYFFFPGQQNRNTIKDTLGYHSANLGCYMRRMQKKLRICRLKLRRQSLGTNWEPIVLMELSWGPISSECVECGFLDVSNSFLWNTWSRLARASWSKPKHGRCSMSCERRRTPNLLAKCFSL